MDLKGVDLSDCDLSDSNFNGSSLVGAKLSGAKLVNTSFSKSDLSNVTMARANLEDADLGWAKFSGADLVGANLKRVHARAANFTSALLIRTRFNDADCLGAIFSSCNATAAQFESANLECADFSAASLTNANLRGVNGSWTNFTNARLNWAVMAWSQLEASDFENANLTGANLRSANLSFANLKDAVLTGANFYFTNLSGAVVPKLSDGLASTSSTRLSYQTFTRSQWTNEDLEMWQRGGATILDLEAFPRDVQNNIRNSESNLRLSFSMAYESDAQVAMEALIYYIFGPEAKIQIISIANQAQKSQVVFYFDDSSQIDLLTTALRHQLWRENPQALIDSYVASDVSSSLEKLCDVVSVLDELASKLIRTQALVPISEDDQVRVLHSKFDSIDLGHTQKTQVTWSSVSNPRVDR